MRPWIGITQCLDDRGRWRAGREYAYLDAAYARAIDSAGGRPVHLPIQSDPADLVARLDGLLIPGGDDFPPPPDAPYPPDTRFDPAPARQRDFDLAVLDAALAQGLPVLGLCYGMQLLAVAAGGALHYHVPLDLPGCADHRLPEPDGRHDVRTEPGTRLAAILGTGPVAVNSLHHQAVAVPGHGWRVAARAGDGLIEAIERASGPFAVGVQWHPEKLDDPRLLRAFVEACRG